MRTCHIAVTTTGPLRRRHLHVHDRPCRSYSCYITVTFHANLAGNNVPGRCRLPTCGCPAADVTPERHGGGKIREGRVLLPGELEPEPDRRQLRRTVTRRPTPTTIAPLVITSFPTVAGRVLRSLPASMLYCRSVADAGASLQLKVRHTQAGHRHAVHADNRRIRRGHQRLPCRNITSERLITD